MKECLICHTTFASSEKTCYTCGLGDEILDGFPAYASAFVKEGQGFKSDYFGELASLEAKNFWFKARNRLIIWAFGNYASKCNSFLEIGCGTGYVLSGIANAYPEVGLQGSELFTAGLHFAASRLPSAHLMQMDAKHIPFVDEFDSIGAFDVLEHINEDTQVLTQIYKALKPNGVLFLTVPQHAWLWSPVDEYACHVRRYSANELHTKLKESGFDVLRSTSFVTSLLPVMSLSRYMQKRTLKEPDKNSTGLEISPWLNYIFEKMLNTEIRMIRRGINFPLGGSRLVVARKSQE